MTTRSPSQLQLGLRANLGQFSLLVGVNALVGGMVGQERTVLPLLATRVFHLEAFTAALTFIVAFGVVKAATNFAAGMLSDRVGRKPLVPPGPTIRLMMRHRFEHVHRPNWNLIQLRRGRQKSPESRGRD